MAGRTTGAFPALNPLQPPGGGSSDAFLARIGPGLPGDGSAPLVPASGPFSGAAFATLVAAGGLALLGRRGSRLP